MPKEIKVSNHSTSIGWRKFPPVTIINTVLPVTISDFTDGVMTLSDNGKVATGISVVGFGSGVIISDPYLYSKFLEFAEVGDTISELVEEA